MNLTMTTTKRGQTECRCPVPNTDWEISYEYQSHTGRHMAQGTEFSVTGEPGRFRFLYHVRTPDGTEWISCVGGRGASSTKEGVQMWRSFRPNRIKRVHTLTQRQRREKEERGQ